MGEARLYPAAAEAGTACLRSHLALFCAAGNLGKFLTLLRVSYPHQLRVVAHAMQGCGFPSHETALAEHWIGRWPWLMGTPSCMEWGMHMGVLPKN